MSLHKEAENRETSEYALWLKPGGEVYDVLKRIIDNLADTYGAPKFEPHITVAGGVRDLADNLHERLARAVSGSQPMTLYLKETDFEDELYRSLFVRIAPNDALIALRERCLREFRLEHKSYLPHISLMYRKMESGEKKQIIERVGKRFDLVFIPDKIYLVRVSGPPETWEEIGHAPLVA